MCVRSSRFFGIFAALAITFALCLGGVEANAEVFTVEKKSAADIVGLIGNSISCSYEYNGVVYSTNFTYQGVVDAISAWRGALIDDNDVFINVSQIKDYDFIIYSAPSQVAYGSFGKVRNVTIDFNLYFESYARGGFAMTSPVNISSINDASNSISSFPNNYAGDFSAISANRKVDASLADYYAVVSGSLLNGNQWNWRPILYKIQSGGGFSGVHFDNVIAAYDGTLYFGIWCPYVGGSMETAPPVTTTTSGNSGGATIINNNVDLTETHSILGGISNFLQDIWESIRGLPGSILSGIQAIFVPEDGYFDSKVAQVKAKFSWYEDIVDAWTEFKTALNGISADSPPSITLSLDNRTFFGRPIGSGSGTALVLDWMYTYRNTIRNLLSAFMWIFFIWRLYCHIPNIISGSGMEVQKTDEGAAWTIHGHKL